MKTKFKLGQKVKVKLDGQVFESTVTGIEGDKYALVDGEEGVLYDESWLTAVKSLDVYLWVARDKDRELFVYVHKPSKGQNAFFNKLGTGLYIGKNKLPSVTWENSPVKFRLINDMEGSK